MDVVIIGAGHNGLVAASYLARAGLKTLVLERREEVGGAAITGEICPGFRAPTLAHDLSGFSAAIARDLQLARFGVEPIQPEVELCAPTPDDGRLVVFRDEARTIAELRRRAPADADRYVAFQRTLRALRPVVRSVIEREPPATDRVRAVDAWALLLVARRFRALPRVDRYRLLRYVPMPVADLVSEWFEDELLRAAIAAPALLGAFAGPRSAGTGAMWLWFHGTYDPSAGFAPLVRGGPGALSRALADAARAGGAEIRTGADVVRILVRQGRACGVALASGEEIAARAVVSNADPRRTLLQLVDPEALDPSARAKVRHYRARGTAAKLNLALEGLPMFRALASDDEAVPRAVLSGRLHVGPSLDYLERAFDAAKYGEFSPQPFLTIWVPSIADPSLAPPGGHVMSIYVQYAPYGLRRGDWRSRRDELADTAIRTLAEYAPDLPDRIRARQIVTPLDLEETYGLTGGHPLHGEPSLDQLFVMRPLYGWARYRMPLPGLYLCGAGAHPGGGVTGLPGRLASRAVLRDLR